MTHIIHKCRNKYYKETPDLIVGLGCDGCAFDTSGGCKASGALVEICMTRRTIFKEVGKPEPIPKYRRIRL